MMQGHGRGEGSFHQRLRSTHGTLSERTASRFTEIIESKRQEIGGLVIFEVQAGHNGNRYRQ